MSAADDIRLYVKQITKGMVVLTPRHTTNIINMVLADKEKVIEVQRYRYSALKENYELIHTFFANPNEVKEKIEKLKGSLQIKYFYMFRIPSLDFEIYSVNINLF